MNASPACPVCGAQQWQELQKFTYLRSDQEGVTAPAALFGRRLRDYGRILLYNSPRPQRVSIHALTEKERRCRSALFETWFKGQESAELTSVVCEKCGFGCYAPRPSNDDLREKYAFYNAQGWDIGGQAGHSHTARSSDAARAERIFELTADSAAAGSLSVLDYGGGNGKLLRPFLERGHRCCIIDYSNDILPGIEKLGDDIESLSTRERFDLIIISHVLEHVAEPRELLGSLRAFMKPDGRLYAEVPMEIWAGIRIGPDPITHVNYFTPASFNLLVRKAGLRPVEQRTTAGSYGASRLLVSWILADARQSESAVPPAPGRDGLHPGRLYSLGRIAGIVVRPKLRRFFRRSAG